MNALAPHLVTLLVVSLGDMLVCAYLAYYLGMCARRSVRWSLSSVAMVWLALTLAGCGRDSGGGTAPARVEVTAPPSPRAPRGATNVAGTASAIPDSGNPDVTLRNLTQALRDYVVRSRSVPKDFEEFAAKAQVSFPPPPSGKKYVIHGQEVILVKQ